LDAFTELGVILIIALLFIVAVVVIVPAALQISHTYTGIVSSISIQTFGIETTRVNFQDGSWVLLNGIHDVSLGNHTLKTVSSWAMIENLRSLDGVYYD